jgi:hypothetical protein
MCEKHQITKSHIDYDARYLRDYHFVETEEIPNDDMKNKASELLKEIVHKYNRDNGDIIEEDVSVDFFPDKKQYYCMLIQIAVFSVSFSEVKNIIDPLLGEFVKAFDKIFNNNLVKVKTKTKRITTQHPDNFNDKEDAVFSYSSSGMSVVEN